jgi:hypothetical protein
MKSQIKNESQSSAAQNGMTRSEAFLPLVRLALLIVPEVMVFTLLSRSPVVSWFAAVVVLGAWLTVDVWPFRVEAPKMARACAARPAGSVAPRKRSHAEWANYLFCRLIVFALMFHSKLTI